MNLKEQLAEDMKAAMRSGDTLRRDTVRMARNAIEYAEKAKGQPLDHSEELVALQQQAKQRKDSIEAYHAVGRTDAEAQEAAELAIIEQYLPSQMNRDEIVVVAQGIIERRKLKIRKQHFRHFRIGMLPRINQNFLNRPNGVYCPTDGRRFDELWPGADKGGNFHKLKRSF